MPQPNTTTATVDAYRDVLHRHGYVAIDTDASRFHHPTGRAVVAVTDAETTSATIAAPAPDSTQRYRWEIDLHGVPAAILDATLSAAATDA